MDIDMKPDHNSLDSHISEEPEVNDLEDSMDSPASRSSSEYDSIAAEGLQVKMSHQCE